MSKLKNPELDDDKKKKIALSVALGALKYSMLSRDNTKIVTFDWDKALDYNGQAASLYTICLCKGKQYITQDRYEYPRIN